MPAHSEVGDLWHFLVYSAALVSRNDYLGVVVTKT